MGYFEQILGTELGLPARAVVALLLVLGLIAITVWLIRRFGDGRVLKPAGGRGRQQQRLAVLDSAAVDARRRLVLIRRDNIEHLILIGGPTDVVVEPNIVRGMPLPAAGPRPLARPGVYDPTEGDYESSLIPNPEPAYEAPERPAPARAMYEPPRSAPRPAPRPEPRSEPRPEPHYSDMASRMEAALRRPEPEIAPRPAPMAPPRMPERAPEPRLTTVAPPRPPAPRAPEPPPRPAAPRAPEPPPQKNAADVFGNLEDEMASLLRPGGKSQQ